MIYEITNKNTKEVTLINNKYIVCELLGLDRRSLDRMIPGDVIHISKYRIEVLDSEADISKLKNKKLFR